jgi:chromosome segregation ATPase
MTTYAATFDKASTLASFRDWHSEQEALDAQLSESLDALAAYQSQLDAWQLQLAGERAELRQAREQLERDRADAERAQAQPSPEIAAELNETQEKMATLTASLLARTEELRTLDVQRAEVASELELSRARETELTTALDEQQRSLEQERAQWTDELQQLREMLALRAEEASFHGQESEHGKPSAPDQPVPRAGTSELVKNNPVLGSIVEQFGKLRQQRANERQTFQKTR